MVYFFDAIYEISGVDCAGLFGAVLFVSEKKKKKGTGKKIRSVAYFPGEYHRSACFYSLSLFGKTDGLFQKDAVCILLL